MEKRTTDSILTTLKEMVEERKPMHPSWWLEAAQDLNLLMEADQDKLFTLEQELAVMRSSLVIQGESVASAKIQVEANPKYLQKRKLEAKIKRIQEMVMIAKKQATMKDNQFNSYPNQ
jgi:hypothetical protein